MTAENPQNVQDVYDEETYRKWRRYDAEKMRLGILSSMVSTVVLAVLLFACGTSGYFNLFALVLPLVFVQPTITIAEFFRKSGEKKS